MNEGITRACCGPNPTPVWPFEGCASRKLTHVAPDAYCWPYNNNA
jgi:hypothetical protein